MTAQVINTLIEFLAAPFSHAFLLRGLLAGVLVAAACSCLSVFVVWRGMSFLGDAIAHAILPGVVLAYAIGANIFIGALLSAIAAIIGISTLASTLKEDTAIGVVFAGFFALGIVLLSRVASTQELSHILFGNMLGVSVRELWLIAGIAVFVLAAVAFLFRHLLITSFDPAHAVAIGISPKLVRFCLLFLLALTTVVAMQTVGVVLVIALLTIPASLASLLSGRVVIIIIISAISSVLATVIGLYTSFYWDLSSGGAIVLSLTGMFVVVFVFRRKK